MLPCALTTCLRDGYTAKDDDEIRCILRAAVSSLVDANERGVKGADRVLEVMKKCEQQTSKVFHHSQAS